jgi:hypothetical protein
MNEEKYWLEKNGYDYELKQRRIALVEEEAMLLREYHAERMRLLQWETDQRLLRP